MPRVQFRVRIPSDPSRQGVVVVGSDRMLGDWQPEKGFVLRRVDADTYTGAVDVPRGPLEFKLTRGSWATEQALPDGCPPENAHCLVTHDMALELEVPHWHDAPPLPPEHLRGQTITCELNAQHFQRSRRIVVWLPPAYRQSAHSRHPVLYLVNGSDALSGHEGSGRGGLCADWIARQWADAEHEPQPVIVAPVLAEESTQRDYELSPQCDGPMLADFLMHDVKPFIDYLFCRDRTEAEPGRTAVLGCGLAGALALFMALRHSGSAGLFACLSPAYPDLSADDPSDCWLLDQLRSEPRLCADRRIYLDHGTRGTDAALPPFQQAAAGILQERGFVAERDFRVLCAEGAAPEWCAWRARLAAPLQFLLGTQAVR